MKSKKADSQTTDEGPIEGKPIAAAFRAARGWLGWSQTRAARQAALGLSTLRALEQGTASPETLIAVDEAYREAGVAIVDLPDGGFFIGDRDAGQRYADGK